MADSPLSNVGLGMMGSDVAFAKAAMQGDGQKGPLDLLLGKGFEWLGDKLSGKAPEGAVPSPKSDQNVSAPQPVPPVDYSIGGPVMPQQNAAVSPYAQVPPAAGSQTTPTANEQFTVGGYRKFLRPQGYGTVTQ